MDYEVFLVSRMHEEWLKLRDNDAAVRIGQAITGKTISAAAAIMIVVFSSFVITTDRTIKMIGLGMAVAILIDALLIRTVLVPAVMHTFGKYNWALPAFLDRRLPRLSLEASEPPGRTPEATPRRAADLSTTTRSGERSLFSERAVVHLARHAGRSAGSPRSPPLVPSARASCVRQGGDHDGPDGHVHHDEPGDR
jgi:putative drug exporter of the RND superfamily